MMKNNEIVLASKNAGKIREIGEMLSEYGLELKSIADFNGIPAINENGSTFEENALIKATVVSDYLQMPVIADDSGLVIKALNGEPGIRSARYAGDHNDDANIQKVLDKLKGQKDRSAYFNTTLVARKPSGEKLTVSGREDGEITSEPIGTAGFGYDPIFYVPKFKKTMAQLSDEEKNSCSSRGKAIEKLSSVIEKWW